MIIGIQILGLIFCLIMLYFTYLYYKRNVYSKMSFSVWFCAWIVAAILVIIPSLFYGIMDVLKVERTADVIVAAACMFFAIMIFYHHTVLMENKKKMEKLVREVALNFPK